MKKRNKPEYIKIQNSNIIKFKKHSTKTGDNPGDEPNNFKLIKPYKGKILDLVKSLLNLLIVYLRRKVGQN
jgi:hypothetical protein